jgi:hypothetical protein
MLIFILESIGTTEVITLAVGILAFFAVRSLLSPTILSSICRRAGILAFYVMRSLGWRNPEIQQTMPKTIQSLAQNTFQVKICPTCRRTYSDISLNFCLDDGMLLSSAVTVQTQSEPEEFVTLQAKRDPEKTLFLPRVR